MILGKNKLNYNSKSMFEGWLEAVGDKYYFSISQSSSPLCNPLGLDQSDLNYRMTILAKRVLAAAWLGTK